SETPEIFTAASLLLVVATAALMQAVGLSMALGAFLAGVLLAESEYRRELETDIEPFKGLLLGLFFIAVGMSIDFAVVMAPPLLLVAADRWWSPRLAGGKARAMDEIAEPQHEPVIIAGFGRYGQIVGRLLYANGVTPTVLDHDAEQIEAMRRFGWPVFYGDA